VEEAYEKGDQLVDDARIVLVPEAREEEFDRALDSLD
jgi:hypothetical protein